MSVIKLQNFGGLVPKASARSIPGDGAQTATNVRADSMEFRPLMGDTTIVANSGVTNPQTLHRLARKADGSFNDDLTAGWIVKAGAMSFAKWPLNSDTTERTCATFDDASAPPRVYTASDLVTGRQLGVPAPTAAPALSVNVVDEFTVEERAAGVSSTLTYLYNEARAKCQMVWLGADHPTANGYADRDSVIGGDPEEAQQVRIFRTGSSGGAFGTLPIDETYTGVSPAAFTWISDAVLGGYWQTHGSGWPSWATSGRDHFLVPFAAYGRTYTVDTVNLTTVLTTLATPGKPGVALLDSTQAAAIITKITDYLTWKTNEAVPKVNALKAKVQEIHTVLDYGIGAATATAYWATSPITTAISQAVAAAAERIWNEAVKAHNVVDLTAPSY